MSDANHKEINFAVIVLAAGASTRLGRPKQLLNYKGSTLLAHSVKVAVSSEAQNIIVVLGAEADQVESVIDMAGAEVLFNPQWKEGMASSIRCGMEYITKHDPKVEGVIIMVCDQPKISSEVLQKLIIAYNTSGKPIIASGYGDSFGPPVLFHRSYFDVLLRLKKDVGAKSVIFDHLEEAEFIPFPEGNFDIDTEADYEKLKRSENS